MSILASAQRTRNRYERVAEQSPALLTQLQDAAQAGIDLRDEAALARTLLDTALSRFAQIHAQQNGVMDPNTFLVVWETLKGVQRIVKDAADIEAKRDDQKLSAAHVLLLVSALRDELSRQLSATFGEQAAELVNDVFTRAAWTRGTLSENDVREALAAPAAYDVSFRLIEKADGVTISDEAHKLADFVPPQVQDPEQQARNAPSGVPDAVAAASVNGPGTPRSAPGAAQVSRPLTPNAVAAAKLAQVQEQLARLQARGAVKLK